MTRVTRLIFLSTLCALLPAFQGGCQQRSHVSRQTRAGESRAALLGLESLQVALDEPELAAKVRALKQGEQFRHTLADGDSVLVKREGSHVLIVIDDSGEMPDGATAPDGDSPRPACIALDMDRDGSLDRTIDYHDLDGDGFVDEMLQTYSVRSTWGYRPFLVVVRDFDQGPLRLWSLHDYGYMQHLCQWDCDFGGAGWFSMFARDGGRWKATLEAPFCFYDADGDALAEETVRLMANGTRLRSARYSINADNDTTDGQLYDYDVGVTCLGSVEVPADAQDRLRHRSGDEIGPVLRWEDARTVVRDADWQRCLLIWDESDHNTAAGEADHERWEGILNAEWRGFPQEGGPPTRTLNKRFELDDDYSGRMRLYWWPADGRLHLHGAEQGAIEVDFDYDGALDLHVEYADTDADGFFDRRTVSYPGTDLPDRRLDGPREYATPRASGDSGTLAFSYEAIAPFWPRTMNARSQAAADVLAALQATADRLGLPLHRAVLDFYETATPAEFRYIERLRASAEARRYYRDVALELAFAHLIADARGAEGISAAEIGRLLSARELYDAGDLIGAKERLLGPAGR